MNLTESSKRNNDFFHNANKKQYTFQFIYIILLKKRRRLVLRLRVYDDCV